MTDKNPQRPWRCPVLDTDDLEPNRNIRIYRQDHFEYLSEKELIDYRDMREEFLEFLLHLGKEPEKANGYSPHTVANTADKMGQFDRWVWDKNGGYTMPPSHEDAVEYMEEVLRRDIAESTKGKYLDALKRYSKWLQRKFGQDEWEFRWSIRSGGRNDAPRDYLTEEERRKIRQAALKLDGTPAYGVEDGGIPPGA